MLLLIILTNFTGTKSLLLFYKYPTKIYAEMQIPVLIMVSEYANRFMESYLAVLLL